MKGCVWPMILFLIVVISPNVFACRKFVIGTRSLENTLLDRSTTPRLKICDFCYSKSGILHSQPKSTVGKPVYIAPKLNRGKSMMER
ncbi:hypothetical protein IFM89_025415 [Coptis chinensis]|uniref:Uncharacterized protein n=1 Tax=Coptis chinensis TaxID=261450 RepID=A0A835H2J3_9MAGN|nr:hypothetical protein IFM89_025415 [Coptis chinensis]